MQNTSPKRALFLGLALALSPAVAPTAQAGSEPYLSEIMLVGSNFCPRGWMEADGRLLAITENQALFSLLGTAYGGDGRTTFALPDLRVAGPFPKFKDNPGSFKWCIAVQGIYPSRN